MKKIHVILFLFSLMLMSSCASLYVSNKQLMAIEQGMNQNDVKKVLGKPDYRRFDGEVEEWEYYRYMTLMGYTTVIVRFIDKEVIGMDSFQSVPAPASTTTVITTSNN